jgi:DNA-binding NtrC family response regulator
MNPAGIAPNQSIRTTSSESHAIAFSDWYRTKEIKRSLQRSEAGRLRACQEAALVVIVDDQPIVAITLTEILRRWGLNAAWFSDPLVALAFIEDGPTGFVLSDMPLADGGQLVTLVRNLRPSCGFFLYSSVSDQLKVIARIAALELPLHLEPKPLPPPSLVAILNSLLSIRSDQGTDSRTVDSLNLLVP